MHSLPSALAILTVKEMAAADRAASAAGVPTLALMEAAGAAVAAYVKDRWSRRPVVVLAGPGNNGDDGFVAARVLAKAGWPVRVALFADAATLAGDAAVNAKAWNGGVAEGAPAVLDGAPLVIDAVFGAGLNRPLKGAVKDTIARINRDNLVCIAVDVPSGVAGDTGEILGCAPRCAATVSFFRPKPAHFLYPGRDVCGDVHIAGIGIAGSVLSGIGPRLARNAPGLWTLPRPTWSDHKYTRGSAVVVGGGIMTGAARLAGRAARRVGAGLLTFAVPSAAADIYAIAEAGALIARIKTPRDLARLLADPRHRAVVIGPGLGRGAAAAGQVRKVLAAGQAAVLDADALSAFAGKAETLFAAIHKRTAPVVMTPHAGEFRRLFGDGKAGKVTAARKAAKASGAVVVLKGPDTVVAAPDGRAAVSGNAPPWLASGGTGDVLAGLIGGLLAQGMAGFEAACAGVWLHGAAGEACGRGLIAEDLPEALPKLLKSL